ncbi:MAG: outer membrane beta-barrel family protein, partial [Flavobacterium stagni]
RNTFLPNYYYNPSETVVLSSIINSQYTPVTINVGSLKSDYEQRLWKGKMGAGFKTSLVETENTFDVYNYQSGQPVYNTTLSNRFNYKENINALYVNYNRLIKKFNFQLGLRMENTNSDGNLTSTQQNNDTRVRRHYTDLFPSGGITFNQNESNSWAVTYSRRIERPSYNSLNPFEYQIDELSVSKGNPFLQPQFVHNITASHTYKYKLNTSLSYSYVSDFFAQVTEAVGQNKSRMTTKNVANQETINLGISYPFTVKNWWSVYLSVNAFRSKYIPTDPSFTGITQETLNIYGQNNFKLPKGINLEVSGWFNSPSVWGGTYRTASLGSLDMAVQKKFLKDKMTLRLAVSDIFYTSPWTGKTEFANVIINGRGGSDSRQVRFSLAYNFGNDQVKKVQNRSTGVEDEKNRIGG